MLQYQATQHQKKWQRDKTQQYESWLESAVTGGMRGLFRALKSPEANLDRPYRDVPCELRPHVRRAWWFEVWQPRPKTPQYTKKGSNSVTRRWRSFSNFRHTRHNQFRRLLKSWLPRLWGLMDGQRKCSGLWT